MKTTTIAFLGLLLFAGQAYAQGFGGGGGGWGRGRGPGAGGNPNGGMPNNGPGSNNGMPNRPSDMGRGPETSVPWAESIEDAVDRAGSEKQNVLLWVHESGQSELPALANREVHDLIENQWVLTRQSFSKKSEKIVELKITSAPTLLAMDRYLNDFGRLRTSPGSTQLEGFLRTAQKSIDEFVRQLEESWSKAQDHLKAKNEPAAIKLLVEIVLSGKKGYPKLALAKEKLTEIAEGQFKLSEALLAKPETEKDGANLLESVAKLFKGTPASAEAELRLARYALTQRNIPGFMARVERVSKLDVGTFKEEIQKASALLEEFVSGGIEEIRKAIQFGIDGDLDQAKTKIERIRKDYNGTPVAKHATDVLKDLEK